MSSFKGMSFASGTLALMIIARTGASAMMAFASSSCSFAFADKVTVADAGEES